MSYQPVPYGQCIFQRATVLWEVKREKFEIFQFLFILCEVSERKDVQEMRKNPILIFLMSILCVMTLAFAGCGDGADGKLHDGYYREVIMQPKYLAAWTINTGYLPPRQDVVNEPSVQEAIAKTPALKVAFDELPSLTPWVAFPGDVGVKAEKMFADMRDRILSGEAPATALKETQDELNQLLK